MRLAERLCDLAQNSRDRPCYEMLASRRLSDSAEVNVHVPEMLARLQ